MAEISITCIFSVQWISPLGCAMFSLQLHLSLDSPLGKRLPLLQHIIGLALVNTLKGNPTYKVRNNNISISCIVLKIKQENPESVIMMLSIIDARKGNIVSKILNYCSKLNENKLLETYTICMRAQ